MFRSPPRATATLRLVLLLLLIVPVRSAPVMASESGPDKSLALGLKVHDARGGPLMALTLSSGCAFDEAGMTCEADFGPTRLDLPFLAGDLTGRAEVRVNGQGVWVRGLTISLPNALFDPRPLGKATADDPPEDLRPIALTVTGQGSYDPATGGLNLDQARVRLADGSGQVAVLTGSLAMAADRLSAGLDADLDHPDRLLDLLGPLVPEDFARAEFSGPLPLRLELDMTPGQPPAGSLRLALRQPVSLALGPDQAFDLPPFSGLVEVAGVDRPDTGHDAGDGAPHGPGWSVKGSVDVGGKAGTGLLLPAGSRLDFDLDWLERATIVRDISIRPAASSQLPVGRLGMSGSLLTPEDGPYAGGWSSPDLRLWLGPLPLSGQASMDADGNLKAELAAGGLPLERLAPLLSGLTGHDAGQWGMSGTAGLYCDLDSGPEATRADMTLRFNKAGFFDAEGLTGVMAGAQNLDLDLRMSLVSRSDAGRTDLSAQLDVDKGEFLYSTMYFDFTRNPFSAKCSGRILGGSRLEGLNLAASWQGFFDLDAAGRAVLPAEGREAAWSLEADLRDVNLGPVFQTFVAVPQGLSSLQGEGAGLIGTAGLALALDHADGVTDLSGRLTLDADLAGTDNSLAVEDLEADLPLAYSFGGDPLKTSAEYLPPEVWGTLSIKAVRTPLVEVRPGELRVALAGNRLYVDRGLDLPLYGGVVSLDRIECDNPLSGDFLFLTDLSVRDLDLANLGGAVPLRGVLHGDLGRVSFSRQLLVVPGMLKGDFFGGDLSLWGVFMENPLSDSRRFGLDLVIRGLDLEPLSQATDFGRVTGLLDVELRGLTVAYGEPVTMWLMARTPEDDDSSKTVSLKAVNSLSVLGTGSGIGDVGVGMFASFFEEFDYSRIGFLCELDNDRFTLSGLIREGGVEYLIKKPFLTGINVVNRSPDSTVSFRDMMERVERVVGDESSDGPQIELN